MKNFISSFVVRLVRTLVNVRNVGYNTVAFVALFATVALMSGCSVLGSNANQMFSGADLVAVSNDRGVIGNDSAQASYAVASVTSAGTSVEVVVLKGENGFAIKAAAVIPFDKVLEAMPRTVSEALALCQGADAGLKLNVDSKSDEVVWPAKADGSINTLFLTLTKPGMLLSTDVDVIVHFTFSDHRLVRVDQRQIMAWSRGLGLVVPPAAPVAPVPPSAATAAAPVAPVTSVVATAAPAPAPTLGAVVSVEPVGRPAPSGTVTLTREQLQQLLEAARNGSSAPPPSAATTVTAAAPAPAPVAPTPPAASGPPPIESATGGDPAMAPPSRS